MLTCFLSTFSHATVYPLQAYRSGFEFPRYVWIAYNGDYTGLSVTTTLCSSSQLAQFLEGVFTLVPFAGGEAVSEDVLEVCMILHACSLASFAEQKIET